MWDAVGGNGGMCRADGKPLVPHIMAAVLSILHHFRPAEILTAAADALRPLLATSAEAFGATVSELVPAAAWTGALQQQASAHADKLRATASGASARAFEAAFADFVGLLRGAMHRK